MGDLDGDGLEDLYSGDGQTGAVWRSGGAGDLDWTTDVHPAPFGTNAGRLPDLDGDGLDETYVYTAGWVSGGPLEIYASASRTGVFGDTMTPRWRVSHPTMGYEHVPSVGDVDGDGLGDLVVNAGGRLRVYLGSGLDGL